MKKGLLLLLPLAFASHAIADDGSDFWLNKNQQGLRLLKKNQPQKAIHYFQDPYWQGIAAYRSEDYANAAALFADVHTSDGLYNFGNALAKQGLYQDAIDAYDAALKQNPNHQDAQYNRDVIRKLLNAQQQEQQQKSTSSQNQKPPQAPEKTPDETTSPLPSKQTSQKNEEQLADEQQLRQIPDDPGGLLRRKFLRDHKRSN